MKTLIVLAMLGGITMTALAGQALAHHKPGYHDSLPKPQTVQLPSPSKARN
ncbi:MAG: hypothetical protein K8F92_04960 [Hyphomicrobium sp.]|uniref:hypothetical protein n=1 Tax=Hyphomicrobium sp. TaxID=82 RepID=UPI0022C1C12F|nr:hypothetical protein [Hyphomicrobium sp.]MBZ0208986.1 hypothetical protein [Hyphomicrobium sp.]MCZ7594217.1 hypothetical protein [Hyphomicrobium sp.]